MQHQQLAMIRDGTSSDLPSSPVINNVHTQCSWKPSYPPNVADVAFVSQARLATCQHPASHQNLAASTSLTYESAF